MTFLHSKTKLNEKELFEFLEISSTKQKFTLFYELLHNKAYYYSKKALRFSRLVKKKKKNGKS